MNKTAEWTKAEVKKLKELNPTHPKRQIAKLLGRSQKAVEQKLAKLRAAGEVESLGQKRSSPPPPDEPLAEYWRKEAETAKRKLAEIGRQETAVDVLVEKATELAPIGYQPPVGKVVHAKRSKGSPQSALLMLSDTHIGQVVHADQTLDLGGYNFDLFLRRLQRLERSVFSILEDHTTTEVPEIVVAMLGDMIHGNLSHAVEAGQVNTLFTQFYSAGHALAQFLRNISALAPIRVHTAVGNHPRWGTQKKMPTDNRYSNLDQFLYAYVAALLRDVPTISFNLCKQPFALFEVQGHRFYAGHGDHLRGGDRMLGVPNHAIGRNLSNNSQLFSRAGKSLPNYYLFGHFHRPITLPHAAGEIIINGGFPGLDGFGLMEAFNSSLPSQKFFLVHPSFGKAASYDLRLDIGDATPSTYKLPEDFQCK